MSDRNQMSGGEGSSSTFEDAPTTLPGVSSEDAPTICSEGFSFEDAPTVYGGGMSFEDAPTVFAGAPLPAWARVAQANVVRNRPVDEPDEADTNDTVDTAGLMPPAPPPPLSKSTGPVETLKDLLVRYPRGLSRSEAVEIIVEVARQIRGRTYGTLSSETVFLCRDGKVELRMNGVRSTRSLYSAPEFQCADFAGDDCSNVFSLGVLFHELLTGMRPYRNPDVATFEACWVSRSPIRIRTGWRNLFSGVNGVLRRALAFDRERRYQNVEDFLAGVRRIHCRKEW